MLVDVQFNSMETKFFELLGYSKIQKKLKDADGDIDKTLAVVEQVRLAMLDESKRRDTRKPMQIVIVSAVFALIALGLATLFSSPFLGGFIFFMGVSAAYGFVSAWGMAPQKFYNFIYKMAVVPCMLKGLGSLKYDMKGFLSQEKHRRMGVIDGSNKVVWSGEDYISGMYNTVQLEFSELSVAYKATRFQKPKFKGAVLALDQLKEFATDVYITTDIEHASRIKNRVPNLDVYESEDDFGKTFYVLVEKEKLVEVVLSPELKENILKLFSGFKAKFGSHFLAASFIGQKALVAVNYDRDLFESPNIKMPVQSRKDLMFTQQHIRMFFNIADVLSGSEE